MADQGRDPVVREFRDRIAATDRAILHSVNRRLELVAQLHLYKAERGYPLVDRDRERALLDELDRLNAGPLSSEGLRELFGALLAVSKREAAPASSQRL